MEKDHIWVFIHRKGHRQMREMGGRSHSEYVLAVLLDGNIGYYNDDFAITINLNAADLPQQ